MAWGTDQCGTRTIALRHSLAQLQVNLNVWVFRLMGVSADFVFKAVSVRGYVIMPEVYILQNDV